MTNNTVWAIIGGGNGGQSMAGHLALMGYPVRLYDIFQQTVDVLNDQGGIHVDGIVEGFGQLQFATMDIAKAVHGADVIAVVAPATSHQAIAESCLSHLVDDQIILLHPGATCGALAFRKALDDGNCKARITIAETNSLIYACRTTQPGHASILGVKQHLLIAALPAVENDRVLAIAQEAFPQIECARNVLETSLENANAIMHPTPTILNTSLIESSHDWLYYWEGVTPSIGRFVEELDQERLEIGKEFGLELGSIMDFYHKAYLADADNLTDAVRKNLAYEKIPGQKNLQTRYLQEDIPMGLVPMIELGKSRGVSVSRMETIAKLGEFLLGENYFANGRTLESLGLADMSVEELNLYLQTGERTPNKKTMSA